MRPSKKQAARPRPASRPGARSGAGLGRGRTAINRSPPRIIIDERDISAGMRALKRDCAVMRRLHDLAGDPPLRRNPAGFAGLARIVIGQQVSVASANAIWQRFETVAVPMTPQAVAQLTDDDFRRAGLSRPKIKTMRAIAAAAGTGLDLEALTALDEASARAQLLAIPGIGPWTADVYLMFCAGHADVFASGDLALQIAAQLALELDERPDARTLAAIAERWSPWRGVAARMLWAYYKIARQTKSGAPV